jgi:hypothetical protein
MQRREFIAGFRSTAAWLMAARAQQADIGILTVRHEDDPEEQAQLALFHTRASEFGLDRMSQHADGRSLGRRRCPNTGGRESVGWVQPEVIVSGMTVLTAAFQQETRTIPVVLVGVSDSIGAGFVESRCE